MRNKLLFMFQAIIVAAAAVAVTVIAAEPGSSEDPVVSKSYVDERIEQLLTALESGETIDINKTPVTSDGKVKYVPVHVGVGQKLLGGEGTEIILRVGRSFAVVSGKEALIDVTDGKEMPDTSEIKKNHVIIVPRNDGRGVRVVEDAWFLVKGEYTVS